MNGYSNGDREGHITRVGGNSVIYRNVQGMATKWNVMDGIGEYDLIILAETFVEKGNCGRAEEKLPPTHNWIWAPAKREKKGGERWEDCFWCQKRHEDKKILNLDSDSHMITQEVEINGHTHMIIGVYNRAGLKNIEKVMRERLEEYQEGTVVIGDWNARIGALGNRNDENENERKTRDPITIDEGIRCIKLTKEYGLELLNGNAKVT